MIVSASYRTDIPAFYGDWFLKRLEAGVCRVVNPYGGQTHEHRSETPSCPVLLHFGERDPIIPNEHVAEIAARHPDVAIFTYDAGHGFNCRPRADYDADSAALALSRSLAFLTQHLV